MSSDPAFSSLSSLAPLNSPPPPFNSPPHIKKSIKTTPLSMSLQTALQTLKESHQESDKGIIIFDLNKKVLYINPKALNLLNKKILPTRNIEELIPNYNISTDILLTSQKINGFVLKTSHLRSIDLYQVEINKKDPQIQLRGFAHDLRNHLANTFAALQFEEKDQKQKMLQIAQAEIQRAIQMLEDELNSENTNFDLQELLKSIEVFIQTKYKSSSVSFSFKIADNVSNERNGPHIKIFRILMNLVNNAFQHTEKGSVSIRITKKDEEDLLHGQERLVFEVSDTGEGIAKENWDKIFEKDIRITHGSNNQGYGLGLYNVKNLAEQIAAQIEISQSSQDPENSGTTFEFIVTLDPPQLPKKETISSDCPSHNREDPIVIIDDDPIGLNLFKYHLEKMGFLNIITATNADDAIKIFNKINEKPQHFTLITDINLSGNTNGFDIINAAKDISKRASSPSPRYIVHSADPDLEKRCKSAMENDEGDSSIEYLSKPVTPAILKKLIDVSKEI